MVEGVDRIVCVGGDGTLNEVINGMFLGNAARAESVLVGYIPCGTGCDFARALSVPANPFHALKAVAHGNRRRLDLGCMVFRGNDGSTVRRYFHNVASFGLGGEVDERVNRSSKALGGFISFIRATLVSVLLFRKKRIRYRLDRGPVRETRAWNVAVANGQYHGGGMWVAPNALPDDGLLHITVIGDFALWEVFFHLPKLYRGTLLRLSDVRSFSCRRIEAWSHQRVLLDVDGEQPGRLPACLEIVPKALTLAVRSGVGSLT